MQPRGAGGGGGWGLYIFACIVIECIRNYIRGVGALAICMHIGHDAARPRERPPFSALNFHAYKEHKSSFTELRNFPLPRASPFGSLLFFWPLPDTIQSFTICLRFKPFFGRLTAAHAARTVERGSSGSASRVSGPARDANALRRILYDLYTASYRTENHYLLGSNFSV